jgi:hypothetical protein
MNATGERPTLGVAPTRFGPAASEACLFGYAGPGSPAVCVSQRLLNNLHIFMVPREQPW